MSEKKRRKKKGRRPTPEAGPFYPLSEVKELIAQRNVQINDNALRKAQEDFGWGPTDILDAILRLESKHFSQSAASKSVHFGVIDVYEVRNLKGENVYTHFYIDDKKHCLVVNSFHRLT